jgi:flagellar protein FlaG
MVNDEKTLQNSSSLNLVDAPKIKTETVLPNRLSEAEQQDSQPLEHEKAEHVVASLNAFVQLMDRNISFEIDTVSGRNFISVFDKETEVLIRQIPSEETIELLKRMDKVVGVLFNENV